MRVFFGLFTVFELLAMKLQLRNCHLFF